MRVDGGQSRTRDTPSQTHPDAGQRRHPPACCCFQRDQVGFNLAYIQENFSATHKEDFDVESMRQLFQLGYDLAKNEYDWTKKPPGC
jgi:hypothetical protein